MSSVEAITARVPVRIDPYAGPPDKDKALYVRFTDALPPRPRDFGPCGVITGFGAATHTAQIEPGATVAVIGCGGVGLSAINGAAIAGAARIIAVDMVESKLELARKFGATDVVNAKEKDAVGEVREMTGGGVHYSFEAIGLKQTAEQAFKMLGFGGTATIIGMIPVGVQVELHGPEFLMERKMQGSNMGSNRFRVDMPRFVEFYL